MRTNEVYLKGQLIHYMPKDHFAVKLGLTSRDFVLVGGDPEDVPGGVDPGSRPLTMRLLSHVPESPVFLLEVDGKPVEFSTNQLLSRVEFQKQMMNECDRVPAIPRGPRSTATWILIMQALLDGQRLVQVKANREQL